MTSTAQARSEQDKPIGPDRTRIRYLTPDMCRIHLGNHNALHVTVKDERIYGGVFAAYAFPVAHPDRYISLIHTLAEKEEIEIGIIKDLKEFPPEDAALVRGALKQRYFVHIITKIKWVGWEYGYICLDSETDKGAARIYVRWATDRAVDYGRRGKVLLDVEDNRYLIPDLDKLTPRERADFTRFIYW